LRGANLNELFRPTGSAPLPVHDEAVTDPTTPKADPRKVRIGLAMISAVVLVAALLFVVLDDAVGRAIMFAVAALGIVRAFLLSRSLRDG
jgi:hypothetical protein